MKTPKTPERLKSSTRYSLVLSLFLGMLFAVPTHGFAYNRDTHQHIVELAYAYLKTMRMCEPIPYSDTEECEASCIEDFQKQDFYNKVDNSGYGGYTCDCIEEFCEQKDFGNCSQEKNGFERYECAKKCIYDNPWTEISDPVRVQCLSKGHESFPTNPECIAPYYYDIEYEDQIFESECRTQCRGKTSLILPSQCASVENAFDNPYLDYDAARKTVKYFQNFKASACPPSAYSYHGQGQCHEENTQLGANKTLANHSQPLSNWRVAAGEKVRLGDASDASFMGREYIPVSGSLLQSTRFLSPTYNIDLTGTIIGYHAGVVDKLDDLYFSTRLIPHAEDAIKTIIETAINGGTSVGAALIGVVGILVCSVACPINLLIGESCGACFDNVFSKAKGLYEKGQKKIEEIEENIWIGTDSTSNASIGDDDFDFTSMFHFMNIPPVWNPTAAPFGVSVYDDIDGYQPATAFGPGLAAVMQIPATNGVLRAIMGIVDKRVDYKKSKKVLNNYQIKRSDDGMRDSQYRNLFYWTRNSVLDSTYMPVDNLAYYWWHKWLNARLNKNEGKLGLLPLGAVFHAVQDITQPFHTWGVTSNGHVPYEDMISHQLDPTSAMLKSGDKNKTPTDLLFDFSNPDVEAKFLKSVTREINTIYREVIYSAGGVLHIRHLMHFLYDRISNNKKTSIKKTEEDGFMAITSFGFDYGPEREFIREDAIPLAVAASVVLLIEGSREDLSQYEKSLGLKLEDFEHVSQVPPLDLPQPLLPNAKLQPGAEDSSWQCTSNTPKTKAALKAYYEEDTITGETLLQIIFAEKTRCDLQAVGMPVDELLITTMGEVEAARFKAALTFFEHGETKKFETELACANAKANAILDPKNADFFEARCNKTLDSDFDGVPDHLDHCYTPRGLLEDGYAVQGNGCAFIHPVAGKVKTPTFILGGVYK